MEDYKILRMPQLMLQTGLARSTIYKLIAAGNFPKPVKLGARASGWLWGDIRRWLEAASCALY